MSGALLQIASAAEYVDIRDDNVSSVGVSTPQRAAYQLENDGDIRHLSTSGGNSDEGDWVRPKSSAPGSYEVRATLNSGTLDGSSDATGSWLALTTSRDWGVTRSTVGTNTAELLIEIRKAGGPVLGSAVIGLSANVTV